MPSQPQPSKLTDAEITCQLATYANWTLSEDGTAIIRKMTFKGFAKATYAANLAIWLADHTNHHPDIQLGWGYCTLTYTTHDVGGLSQLDFDCAARFDALQGS
jgi:4a-hydroxytetrahydrobiopterin dehydratase